MYFESLSRKNQKRSSYRIESARVLGRLRPRVRKRIYDTRQSADFDKPINIARIDAHDDGVQEIFAGDEEIIVLLGHGKGLQIGQSREYRGLGRS